MKTTADDERGFSAEAGEVGLEDEPRQRRPDRPAATANIGEFDPTAAIYMWNASGPRTRRHEFVQWDTDSDDYSEK